MIDWSPWSAEAFARAARERKPVLLSITAAWCRACHEMDATTYADANVEAAVRERFIPVRVDTDRRPDINERYNLGGWPTTAFLTPGGDVLGGGTFVPADRMEGVLRRVADAFATRADEIARNRHDHPPATVAAVSPEPPADVIEFVFQTYDDLHGGFGIEPKFPLVAPLRLALELYREDGAPKWRQIVERSLDAMATGGLRDPADGGFYRYATTRNWQLPHREKLLETNAALLAMYADAASALGREVDRERAADLAAFIHGVLAAPDGGWYGSDSDTAVYLDSTGAAATALLAASRVIGDLDIARGALQSFERILLACYRPGHGVAHYVDGESHVRGLLADQISAIDALLAAFALTDDEPYRMMAEEIGHYTIRMLWDARDGGFRDRATDGDDIGLLADARRPFVTNCEAGRVLAELARTSGERDFLSRAQITLESVAPLAASHGPDAAYYLLAVRSLEAG